MDQSANRNTLCLSLRLRLHLHLGPNSTCLKDMLLQRTRSDLANLQMRHMAFPGSLAFLIIRSAATYRTRMAMQGIVRHMLLAHPCNVVSSDMQYGHV